jgi:hypothetical protein
MLYHYRQPTTRADDLLFFFGDGTARRNQIGDIGEFFSPSSLLLEPGDE